MPHKHFDNLKTKKLPDSEVEITGEITLSFLVECRVQALNELNNRSSIAGFRPGKIPEDVLIKKVGELGVLEESAEIALGKEYPNIIKELNVSAIGRPTISITKLAKDIPLEFKMITAVEPEFKLPDYKKIARDLQTPPNPPLTKGRADSESGRGVLDDEKLLNKEVEDVIAELKKHNVKPELKEGEKLEGKVRENILMEKQLKSKDKKRLTIIEKLTKETEILVPKILIESEMMKMMGQFKDDVTRAGLKWEDYLKQIKKTEQEIKDGWKEQAVSRAKADLIVGKIAIEEKIEPTEAELEHETHHLLEHYKDADPLRVRVYVYQMMRNEKVLELLENLK